MNALQVNPDDFFAYFNLARAYQYQGQFQEAALALQKAVLINPSDPHAQHCLGEIFLKLDQCDEARLCFLRSVAQNPDFLPSYFSLARLLIRQGQLEESIPKLKKVIQLQPEFHQAYKYLAEVYRGIKFTREAVEAINKAVDLVPGNFFYQRLKGELSLELEDYETALNCFRKASNLNPEDRSALFSYANLQFDSGDWHSCLRTLERLTEIEPMDSGALLLLGRCYLEIDQEQDALNALTRVQKIDPLCEEVNLYIAEIYRRSGQWSDVQCYLGSVPSRLRKSMLYVRCLATLARAQGNLDVARSNFENLINQNDSDPDFVLQLATIYRDEARAQDAYDLLESWVDRYGSRYRIIHLMAQLMDQLGHQDRASELMETLVTLTPESDAPLTSNLIKPSYQDSKKNQREDLLRRLQINPEDIELNIELGDLLYEMGELDQAGNYWKIAHATNPEQIDALIRLAELERQKNDLISSLNYLRKAQELSPEDLDLYLSEARLLFETGRLIEARELLLQIKQDFSEEILPILFMLRIARFEDDEDEMLRLSNDLFQLNPNHYYACLIFGILALKKDLIERADQYFTKAVELSQGQDKEPIYYLGIVKKIQGDLRQAYRCFSRVLELFPEDGYAHYHIGLILKLKGNYVVAEKHLLTARDLDPDDLFTRQHLAMLYYDQQKLDFCLKELLNALVLDEHDFVTNLYLGQAFYEKKSFKKSAFYLQKAQSKNPTDPSVYYHLALSYLELGQNREAVASLEKGIPYCSRDSNLYRYSKELLDRLR